MNQDLQSKLAAAAGPGNLLTSAKDRLLFATDATGEKHPPQAVVRAKDASQVSAVMKVCQEHGVPVVPRGAGSGLTGGALPIAGGVVLDMAGMNRIINIDKANQVAVVEPGVVTADLQAAVEAQGLFYPPDPASVGFCSVGGNVAENAGGLRAVKYGVTRDYVLGLTAVLPDGRIFKTGSGTIKSVVGYDLTRLIVGSEGTLAVIVQLTLRLLPKPEDKRTISGLFSNLDHAARAVGDILASGIRPTALEFMDKSTIKAVEDFAHIGLPADAEAMVLVDVDGPPEVVARQARDVADILGRAGAGPVELAETAEEADSLWRARRAAGPAIYQLAPDKLNEDIVVPLGKLPEMVRRLRDIGKARKVLVVSFGHAGDGNLHVNIMYDSSYPEQVAGAHEAVSDLFAHCLHLGGSLSGEHGVGTAKLGHIGAELDPVSLDLMRSIKQVFDPKGILNPGKAIPTPEMMP